MKEYIIDCYNQITLKGMFVFTCVVVVIYRVIELCYIPILYLTQ